MQDIKLRDPITWTTPRTCSLGQDQPAHRRLSRIHKIKGKSLLPLKNPASMTPQDALKGMIDHPRFLERMKACRQNWAGTPWGLSRTIPEVCQVPNCGSTRSNRRAGVSQAHAFGLESRLCCGFAAGGSSFKNLAARKQIRVNPGPTTVSKDRNLRLRGGRYCALSPLWQRAARCFSAKNG